MSKTQFAFFTVILLIGVCCVSGGPLTVDSYSMINGGNPARSYNYTDYGYSNCPGNDCKTSYYDQLSGGTGKLTDGVSPTLSYLGYPPNTASPFSPANPQPTNPYVGWYSGAVLNPVVNFDFADAVYVDAVTVWLDNARINQVTLPSNVSIGENGIWQDFAITPDPTNRTPRAYTFSNLNIFGSEVQVRFSQSNATSWVMVGEVSFDGRVDTPENPAVVATPEPSTWLMISGGLVLAGLLRRKRVS